MNNLKYKIIRMSFQHIKLPSQKIIIGQYDFEKISCGAIFKTHWLKSDTNEDFLKSFAEKQIPEIYNPEKLNSFKDSICINKSHYKTILYRIYLLDISTGKHRVLVFQRSPLPFPQIPTLLAREKNMELQKKISDMREELNELKKLKRLPNDEN